MFTPSSVFLYVVSPGTDAIRCSSGTPGCVFSDRSDVSMGEGEEVGEEVKESLVDPDETISKPKKKRE